MPRLWYPIHVHTGMEERVGKDIRRQSRIDSLEMQVGRCIVPRQLETVTRKGVRQEHKRKLYPGYVFCQIEVNDDTKHMLRKIKGIINLMIPCLDDDEVEAMLERYVKLKRGDGPPDLTDRPVKLKYGVGDKVTATKGMFAGQTYAVKKIEGPANDPIVIVAASVLGRPIDAQIPYWHLEKAG